MAYHSQSNQGFRLLFVLTACAAGLGVASVRTADGKQAEAFAGTAKVRQILLKHCVECHGGKTRKNGLDLTTRARNTSVSPLQALAMLNNRFMVRRSEHLAERAAQAGKGLPAQVRSLYLLALGRGPTAKEVRALTAYAGKHGLANACRVVLNSNEFMFVD